MTTDNLHRRLLSLIGTRFSYQGELWLLTEVLPMEDAVVLTRGASAASPIQLDQYGAPNRRGPESLTLPLSSPDGADYSEELKDLLAGRQPR